MAEMKDNPIEYWNEVAGPNWVAQQQWIDGWMMPLTQKLLSVAKPASNERVVDVGCGCGDTTLRAAEAVGLGGAALGVDVSSPMLTEARRRAASGLAQFENADAGTVSWGGKAFDLMLSRFGVMFFQDPAHAFSNLRRALRPGGRAFFMVWREQSDNPWIRLLSQYFPEEEAAMKAALFDDGTYSPGPFALSNESFLRELFEGAGFENIEIQRHDEDLHMGAHLDTLLSGQSQIGPFARILASAEPQKRDELLAGAKERLEEMLSAGPVRAPSSVWIASAANPVR